DSPSTDTKSYAEAPTSTVSASTVNATKDDDAEEDPSTPRADTTVEDAVIEEEAGGGGSNPTAKPVAQPSDERDSPTVAAVGVGSDHSAKASTNTPADTPDPKPIDETDDAFPAKMPTTPIV